MDQIYPDTGLLYALRQLVGTKLTYTLYTNNHAPTLSDTLASYTALTGFGSTPIDVLIAAWTFANVVGHIGALQAPNIAWTNGSGSPWTIYGYYIVDSTGSILFAAAQFDGAPITVAPSAGIQVTPILGDYSALSS